MISKYKRKPVRVFAIVILLAGLIAYMGCTGATTSERAAPQATLNPDSALPVLVWTGDKPHLPEFAAWEYIAQPGPPLDIEELLAHIWEGQEYESYDHGEKWDVLPSSSLSEQIWQVS